MPNDPGNGANWVTSESSGRNAESLTPDLGISGAWLELPHTVTVGTGSAFVYQ